MLSRDSHDSGAELMKHQFQNKSSPVFITPEVKEFKLGLFLKKKKKRRKKEKHFVQPSVNMSVGRILQTAKSNIWQKKIIMLDI